MTRSLILETIAEAITLADSAGNIGLGDNLFDAIITLKQAWGIPIDGIDESDERFTRFLKEEITVPDITPAKIARARQCLADNGVEEDETQTVLQALGYILLDRELFPDDATDKER